MRSRHLIRCRTHRRRRCAAGRSKRAGRSCDRSNARPAPYTNRMIGSTVWSLIAFGEIFGRRDRAASPAWLTCPAVSPSAGHGPGYNSDDHKTLPAAIYRDHGGIPMSWDTAFVCPEAGYDTLHTLCDRSERVATRQSTRRSAAFQRKDKHRAAPARGRPGAWCSGQPTGLLLIAAICRWSAARCPTRCCASSHPSNRRQSSSARGWGRRPCRSPCHQKAWPRTASSCSPRT
jgi:hypothetical protein